jgi:hypothetical protein
MGWAFSLEPGVLLSIKLYLRRTLVRFVRYWTLMNYQHCLQQVLRK